MWLDSWTFSLFNQKKKKTDLQIVILEKTHKFFVFLRKMKEKEVKKNLSNEYEPLFIPRGL